MISAYTPVKNEAHFIKLYIEHLKDKVDEIFLLDTGSTDGTLDEIEKYRVMYPDLIKLDRYDTGGVSYTWEEGKVRNYGLSKLKNKWVISLDADEMFSDNFMDTLNLSQPRVFGFPWITMWKDLSTVRVSVPTDNRWYDNTVIKLFHKDYAQWQEKGNHAPLWFDHRLLSNYKNVYAYHFHYALFDRCKANDNRLFDLGQIDYWSKDIIPPVKDEDFDYLLTINHEYTLKTIKWNEPLPKTIYDLGLASRQSPTTS